MQTNHILCHKEISEQVRGTSASRWQKKLNSGSSKPLQGIVWPKLAALPEAVFDGAKLPCSPFLLLKESFLTPMHALVPVAIGAAAGGGFSFHCLKLLFAVAVFCRGFVFKFGLFYLISVISRLWDSCFFLFQYQL